MRTALPGFVAKRFKRRMKQLVDQAVKGLLDLFLDRRIEEVMLIEKVKAQARNNPVLSRLMAGPNWILGQIKAPTRFSSSDFPGRWTPPRE